MPELIASGCYHDTSRLAIAHVERGMTEDEADQRPPMAVAHVILRTARMEESARFMRTIGLRPIFEGAQVSVFELRGGTHLLLLPQEESGGEGDATFDLMVDDLRTMHRRFSALGLAPSAIESRQAIGHEVFSLREPGGRRITFFSSHASGKPV